MIWPFHKLRRHAPRLLDPDGMPGGMLAASIDSSAPAADIIFASLRHLSGRRAQRDSPSISLQ